MSSSSSAKGSIDVGISGVFILSMSRAGDNAKEWIRASMILLQCFGSGLAKIERKFGESRRQALVVKRKESRSRQ